MTSITHFHFTFQLHTSTTHFHFILQLHISTSNLHYNSHFKQCLLTAVIYIHIPLPEVIVSLIASRSAEWPLPEPSRMVHHLMCTCIAYLVTTSTTHFHFTLPLHSSTSNLHFTLPVQTVLAHIMQSYLLTFRCLLDCFTRLATS